MAEYGKDFLEKAKKKAEEKKEGGLKVKPAGEEVFRVEAKGAGEFEKKMQEFVKAPEKVEAVAPEAAVEGEISAAKKTQIAAYGNVKIYKVEGQALLLYYIPVPRPTASEKATINTIKEAATRLISIAPYKIRDPEQKRNVYYQKILEILKGSKELNIPETRMSFYADAVVREMVGYGIIDSLIRDDKLEEIMVIGPQKPVYVFHREFEMMITNIVFFRKTRFRIWSTGLQGMSEEGLISVRRCWMQGCRTEAGSMRLFRLRQSAVRV